MRTHTPFVLVVLSAALLAACSSSGEDARPTVPSTNGGAPSTTEPTPTTTEPTPTTVASTTEPAPTSAVPTGAPPTTGAPEVANPLLRGTDLGDVMGTPSEMSGVTAFLAIPYAEAPVGDLRWEPPVRRAPWSTVFDASQPGAACPQTSDSITAQFIITPDADEDCLTLSVWKPLDASGLPVMVWFHGGGFTTGSAHQPYYIGDQLADRGTVVVNVNYRLGPFGFLDGNHGFLDQIEALDWVQRNIANFGGDPGNVTIFGESAGGFSVCGHLASPQPGVFHRAIIQSGGGCAELQPLDDATTATGEFLAEAGCDDLACLRGKSSDELLSIPFDARLINDKVTLDRSAAELARADELRPVPIMTGFNADEANLFTLGVAEDVDVLEFAANFTEDPNALTSLYPPDEFDSNLARYRALSTDLTFGCSALQFAGLAGGDDTFVYHFTYVSASTPAGLGATHGAEIAFLFGHPEGLILPLDVDAADMAVTEAMQAAWVQFATTGRPGWDPFTDGDVMVFGETAAVASAASIRNGRCESVTALVSS